MCPVDPQTVRAGDIVILPAELEAGQLAILPMNPRCLNHPMVILAPPDGGKNAEATLTTTRGADNFRNWANTHPDMRHRRLPLGDEADNPFNMQVAYLENGSKMNQPCYIQTHETQSIPLWLLLRSQTTRYNLRLSRNSFRILLEALGGVGISELGELCSTAKRPEIGDVARLYAPSSRGRAENKEAGFLKWGQLRKSLSDPAISSPPMADTPAIRSHSIPTRTPGNAYIRPNRARSNDRTETIRAKTSWR